MNDSLQTLSNRLHLYTLPFHANEAVTAFLIYSTTYLFASPALSKWLFPGTYPQLSKRTKINWDVRVVSLVQSTFISAFALFVIGYDDGRQSIGWKDRLWGYLSLGGTVQACAAGYFVWDVVVSATSIEVLGASSLIHAIFALLITSIGFVSLYSAINHNQSRVVSERSCYRDLSPIITVYDLCSTSFLPPFSTSTGSWTSFT